MNQQHLAVAIEAAKAGAAQLMSHRGALRVREKAPKDLVTDADLASQRAVRKVLMEAFDGYAFVGEEAGQHTPPAEVRRGDLDAPPCWVVDPLDGTVNYVHQLPSFAVSIGLYARGKMRLGVIYDPALEELFTAIDGAGAYCNGRPIGVRDCTQINDALIACSFPAGVKSNDREVARFVRVVEHCRSLRRLGSCALNLCYIAAGRLDAYWATSVKSWDAAAGTVIVREAGAIMTADDGSEFNDWEPKFCVSASRTLHQPLLQLLAIPPVEPMTG